MKIKLSKNQWNMIGAKAGWLKISQNDNSEVKRDRSGVQWDRTQKYPTYTKDQLTRSTGEFYDILLTDDTILRHVWIAKDANTWKYNGKKYTWGDVKEILKKYIGKL